MELIILAAFGVTLLLALIFCNRHAQPLADRLNVDGWQSGHMNFIAICAGVSMGLWYQRYAPGSNGGFTYHFAAGAIAGSSVFAILAHRISRAKFYGAHGSTVHALQGFTANSVDATMPPTWTNEDYQAAVSEFRSIHWKSEGKFTATFRGPDDLNSERLAHSGSTEWDVFAGRPKHVLLWAFGTILIAVVSSFLVRFDVMTEARRNGLVFLAALGTVVFAFLGILNRFTAWAATVRAKRRSNIIARHVNGGIVTWETLSRQHGWNATRPAPLPYDHWPRGKMEGFPTGSRLSVGLSGKVGDWPMWVHAAEGHGTVVTVTVPGVALPRTFVEWSYAHLQGNELKVWSWADTKRLYTDDMRTFITQNLPVHANLSIHNDTISVHSNHLDPWRVDQMVALGLGIATRIPEDVLRDNEVDLSALTDATNTNPNGTTAPLEAENLHMPSKDEQMETLLRQVAERSSGYTSPPVD